MQAGVGDDWNGTAWLINTPGDFPPSTLLNCHALSKQLKALPLNLPPFSFSFLLSPLLLKLCAKVFSQHLPVTSIFIVSVSVSLSITLGLICLFSRHISHMRCVELSKLSRIDCVEYFFIHCSTFLYWSKCCIFACHVQLKEVSRAFPYVKVFIPHWKYFTQIRLLTKKIPLWNFLRLLLRPLVVLWIFCWSVQGEPCPHLMPPDVSTSLPPALKRLCGEWMDRCLDTKTGISKLI